MGAPDACQNIFFRWGWISFTLVFSGTSCVVTTLTFPRVPFTDFAAGVRSCHGDIHCCPRDAECRASSIQFLPAALVAPAHNLTCPCRGEALVLKVVGADRSLFAKNIYTRHLSRYYRVPFLPHFFRLFHPHTRHTLQQMTFPQENTRMSPHTRHTLEQVLNDSPTRKYVDDHQIDFVVG